MMGAGKAERGTCVAQPASLPPEHVQADAGSTLLRYIDISSATVSTLAGSTSGRANGIPGSFTGLQSAAIGGWGTFAVVVRGLRELNNAPHHHHHLPTRPLLSPLPSSSPPTPSGPIGRHWKSDDQSCGHRSRLIHSEPHAHAVL